STYPTATNCDAPANTKRLIELASSGENPAALALSPYTSPNPPADTMIPTESRMSRRRDAATSIVGAVDAEVEVEVAVVTVISNPSLTDDRRSKGYGSVLSPSQLVRFRWERTSTLSGARNPAKCAAWAEFAETAQRAERGRRTRSEARAS